MCFIQKKDGQNVYSTGKLKKCSGSISAVIILATFLFSVSSAKAATISASSCSHDDVYTALNTASEGDTVTVPAGTSTWTSGVTIPDGIKLIGAGAFDGNDSNNTVISSSSPIRIILGNNSKLKGFKLRYGMASPPIGSVASKARSGWVIEGNYFGNPTNDIYQKIDTNIPSGTFANPGTGVYHGNTFIGQSFIISGDAPGHIPWYDADNLGGTTAVIYFENNIIDLRNFQSTANVSQFLDSNFGGRWVIRFNNIMQAYLQTHGARNVDDYRRSNRLQEVYGNNWTQPDVYKNVPGIFMNRGGLTISFDNSCTGHSTQCGYHIDSERLYGSHGQCPTSDGFDTIPYPISGTEKSNSLGCRDVMGMGQDITLSPDPRRDTDQSDQKYSPSYIWNLTYQGSLNSITYINGSEKFITENVDFFQGDGTWDQGVTSGAFANAPECNASNLYHGYWATDEGNWNQSQPGDIGYGTGDGVLYQCQNVSGSYSWVEYYTPADYPHPLTKNPLIVEEFPTTPNNLHIE